MFFVFGQGGPIYQGPLENLAEIAPVSALARSRGAHRALAPRRTGAQGEAAAHTLRNDAVSAYAQTQQGEVPARARLELVRDVMSPEAFTLTPEMSVADAWETLALRGVSQAPVVDGQSHLVGLLLRADMLPTVLLPGPSSTGIAAWRLAQQPVSSLMLSPIPAVDADTHLRRASRVMLDLGLPGLPVCDPDGRVIGFISRADILRAVVADPPLDLWT
ncbi:MAG: CBS domain-containing protein [Curvibacter sp.]|nr:CBS domain-containing protein [Curvibacter sp.]